VRTVITADAVVEHAQSEKDKQQTRCSVRQLTSFHLLFVSLCEG